MQKSTEEEKAHSNQGAGTKSKDVDDGGGGGANGIVVNTARIRINKWRVKEGHPVSAAQILFLYQEVGEDGKPVVGDTTVHKFKANRAGVVKKRLRKEGEIVLKGDALLELSECIHTTVIKDMCADCGADLRQNDNGQTSEASVPMVHTMPDLKVTQKLAQKLGHDDTRRLLADRKLVLLVDLDQTVIHTTNDTVPDNIKGIYHFQLYGPQSPWYHTRLRPGTAEFLERMSQLYELHICTFGARNYAHMIAQLLDPHGKFFSHRILSRDECFNATSKTDNLKALFPNGDSMVCIIDDREDVWNMASNLIQVKPYHFFQHTGDINAPPGLSKHELDGEGVDFKEIDKIAEKKTDKDEPAARTHEEPTQSESIESSKADADKGDNTVSSTSKDEDTNEDVDIFELERDTKDAEATIANISISETKVSSANTVDKLNGNTVTAEIMIVDVDEDSSTTQEDKSARNDSEDIVVIDDVPADSSKESPSSPSSGNSEAVAEPDKEKERVADDVPSQTSDATQSTVEAKDEVENNTPATCSTDKTSAEAEQGTKEGSSESAYDYDDDVPTTSKSAYSNVKLFSDGQKQIEIEDPDDYLLYLEVILRNIHKRFYAIYDETTEIPDLKIIVPKIRCEVLRSKFLVFSGLVPTQMKLEQSRAYFIAKSLGAEVQANINKDTTHLVAVNAGTYKVNAAKKEANIKVVNANWLWACAERWEYVEEKLFPLDRKVRNKGRQPPAHCHSPEHVVNYSERSEISPSSSQQQQEQSGNFRETLNPLLVFTNADIDDMNKDYETFFESDSSSDEGPVNFENPPMDKKLLKRKREDDNSNRAHDFFTRTEDVMIGAPTRTPAVAEFDKSSNEGDENVEEDEEEEEDDDEIPSAKFRRGEELPSDLEMGSDSNSENNPEDEDDGEWNMMGAALEREFLGLED